MFTNISWKDFFEFIIFLSVVYYLVIALKYKQEIKKWVQAKNLFFNSPSVSLSPVYPLEAEEFSTNQQSNLYSSCINEIDTFFEEAKGRKWVKEELVYSLKSIFKKYHSLKNSSEKKAVEKVTSSLSKDKCSIHLYEDDLRQLWLE